MPTSIVVAGIKLDVYGLEQYRAQKRNDPVSVVFSMHGRLSTAQAMTDVNEKLVQLNSKSNNTSKPYLLVVSFDHANHGSRLVDRHRNLTWKDQDYDNQSHAIDMWSMEKAAADTVSMLVDVLEFYLFPHAESHIVQYGVLGFSLGGHSAYLANSKDNRLSLCVALVGCADYESLLRYRATSLNLQAQAPHIPERFINQVVRKQDTIHNLQNLLSTKLLMINGQEDKVVPAECNASFVENMRLSHVGTEGKDWASFVLPGLGHAWSDKMIELCQQWCYDWLQEGV